MRKYAPRGRTYKVNKETFELLMKYPWPGNIRELENAIEHAVVMSEGDEITIDDLPMSIRNYGAKQSETTRPVDLEHLTLEEMEKRAILNAMNKTQANFSRAARLLGITRRTLGYRIKKYGLESEIEKLRSRFGKRREGEHNESD